MMMKQRDIFWQQKLDALKQRITVLEGEARNRNRGGDRAQDGVAGNQTPAKKEMAKSVSGAKCYVCGSGSTSSLHLHRGEFGFRA